MIKSFLMIIIAIAFCGFSIPKQEKLPVGVYMSFDEIRRKQPSMDCSFTIKKRDNSYNGNYENADFELTQTDKCFPKKKLGSIWAYSDGITSYVNCAQLKLGVSFYAQIVTRGNFWAFYTSELSQAMKDATILGGNLGTAIALNSTKPPTERKLYVIDIESAKGFSVDYNYMLKILKKYPELYTRFSEEQDIHNSDVHCKYLQLINDSE